MSGRDVGVSELLAPGPGATNIGLSLHQIYGNPYEHRHLTPSLPYTVTFEGEKKVLCESLIILVQGLLACLPLFGHLQL